MGSYQPDEINIRVDDDSRTAAIYADGEPVIHDMDREATRNLAIALLSAANKLW